MTDAGDVGACSYFSPNFESLLLSFFALTSTALAGWGGSGREGKVVNNHPLFPALFTSSVLALIERAELLRGLGSRQFLKHLETR